MRNQAKGISVSRRWTLTIACVIACLATASVASARATLKGKTEDGVTVKLEVDDATGAATSFRIGKQDEIGCKKGGTLTLGRGTYQGFQNSAPGAFDERFKDSDGDGGLTLKTRTRIRGSAEADGSWSGRFKSKTKVLDGNEKLDTCKQRVGWNVS